LSHCVALEKGYTYKKCDEKYEFLGKFFGGMVASIVKRKNEANV
jgi:hypothetical protein